MADQAAGTSYDARGHKICELVDIVQEQDDEIQDMKNTVQHLYQHVSTKRVQQARSIHALDIREQRILRLQDERADLEKEIQAAREEFFRECRLPVAQLKDLRTLLTRHHGLDFKADEGGNIEVFSIPDSTDKSVKSSPGVTEAEAEALRGGEEPNTDGRV